ncbi:MAG TPA: Na+ dependent nucleoside transporter N-terminal domain-containing protein, partial [Salinivirgaceae bacterium]|nr:Na+ dependent nucleoside transporter N-terminal domain-containing protein [Salinivirgaceae bacterium]
MRNIVKVLFLPFVIFLFLTNTTFANEQIDTDTTIALNQVVSDTTAIVSDDAPRMEITNISDSAGMSLYSIFRGLIGMFVLLLLAWLVSQNRKAINWKVVFIGLVFQIILAIGVLYVPAVQWFFEIVGKIFIKILDFTKVGSEFLLGDLLDMSKFGMIFAFQILPTIIFFSALTSVLFYLGIIQKVVYALAWLMVKAMKLSGAESLAVAGNIFLGQTESPLMIKAYLDKMNRSEIFLVMTAGMATVAGGVLA